MKRFFFASILLLFFYIPLACFESESELVSAGHWVYRAIPLLALDSGETTLAVNAPASVAELIVYVGSIRYGLLSANGRLIYRKVMEYLRGTIPLIYTGIATVDARPTLSLSARYIGDTSARYGFESLQDFNSVKPVVSVPLEFGFSPYVTAFSDFSISEGYWASTLGSFSTNVPSKTQSFDLGNPSTAYLSAGNSFFTAVIGRGQFETGDTLSGSMILSDTTDQLNYTSLVFFYSRSQTVDDACRARSDRYAYFHSLSFRPARFLSLSFSEAALVHSALDIRYCNPLMIFHSYAGWRDDYGQTGEESPVGTQLGLSVELVPFGGFKMYGQFVMNQFQTSYELDNYETAKGTPNSFGGLAGLEYVRQFRDGYLDTRLEGVYTNPWLYILDNHAISYYQTRRELVAPEGYPSKEIQSWLGSPYGPDTIAANLSCEYLVPLERSFGISYRYLRKGEKGDEFFATTDGSYYPHSSDEAQKQTPTGNSSTQHTFSFFGSSFCTPALEADGKLGYSLFLGARNAHTYFASCSLTLHLR